MYKVFVDNIPICFQKDATIKSNIPSRFLPSLSLNDFGLFTEEMNNLNAKEVVFINSPDPVAQIQLLFKHFEWIEAAGGIVQNTQTKRYLFIYRNDFWDIPKGKIEDGESPHEGAIREIEEECGLHNLEITKELSPTYHVYFAYGKHFIKKTHWFTLKTDVLEVHPQLEEGITEVKWYDRKEIDTVKRNTFRSIVEVLNEVEVIL